MIVMNWLASVIRLLFLMSAGDFGGILGLLLGGSALSILEIVDLVLYNLVVKFTTRRQVKPVKRESTSPDDIDIPSNVIQVKPANL